MSENEKKWIMMIYVLYFMFLYISKSTFTPTLCNSQDIYVREVLQYMKGESVTLRWPTQGHKARNNEAVHWFRFHTVRGLGSALQFWRQPHASRWPGRLLKHRVWGLTPNLNLWV